MNNQHHEDQESHRTHQEHICVEALKLSQCLVPALIWQRKEYDTTANLPRHDHPPELTGWLRRALIREEDISCAFCKCGSLKAIGEKSSSKIILKFVTSHVGCRIYETKIELFGLQASPWTHWQWGSFSSVRREKLSTVAWKIDEAKDRKPLKDNLLSSKRDSIFIRTTLLKYHQRCNCSGMWLCKSIDSCKLNINASCTLFSFALLISFDSILQ